MTAHVQPSMEELWAHIQEQRAMLEEQSERARAQDCRIQHLEAELVAHRGEKADLARRLADVEGGDSSGHIISRAGLLKAAVAAGAGLAGATAFGPKDALAETESSAEVTPNVKVYGTSTDKTVNTSIGIDATPLSTSSPFAPVFDSGGTRSSAGTTTHMTLASHAATARLRDQNPNEVFLGLFDPSNPHTL